MINARAESLWKKPACKSTDKRRRCIRTKPGSRRRASERRNSPSRVSRALGRKSLEQDLSDHILFASSLERYMGMTIHERRIDSCDLIFPDM